MNISYRLIESGYEILRNDRVIIRQPLSPNRGTQLSIEDAEKLALLIVDKINRGEFPIITIEEENNICG